MTVRQYGIEVEFSTSENPEKKDRDVFDAVFRWVFNPSAEGYTEAEWVKLWLIHLGYKPEDIAGIYYVNNGNTSCHEKTRRKNHDTGRIKGDYRRT